MKLQEQGLLSLEWLDKEIDILTKLQMVKVTTNEVVSAHEIYSKIEQLRIVKKQLISPIPLAEKILNEGVEIGYISTSSKEEFKEDCAKLLKQTFLNSDIQLD